MLGLEVAQVNKGEEFESNLSGQLAKNRDYNSYFRFVRHAPAISDKCHRLSAFLAESQLKDERQVRPEIHMLVSPFVVKFDFEGRCYSRSC